MMATPALRIPVSVDLGQFKSAMDEAGARVHTEAGHIEEHFGSVNKAAAGMALGVVAAGALISTSLLGMVSSLAKLGDLSEEMRLPVNLLQALSVAATEARVPAKDLTAALESFTRASKLGGTEAEKLNESLTNIGANFLKAFQTAGSQEDRLKVVGAAYRSTSDEVKKAQLSIQVFGTDSEKVANLLVGSGASAFDTYKKKAAELGLEVNESLVKSAQEAQSQILTLSRVLTDKFTSALGGLIPVLTRLAPYLNALALSAQAVNTIFATDETATAKQLNDELDSLTDRLVRLGQEKEELRSGKVAGADSIRDELRQVLGIEKTTLEEDFKVIDEDIAKVLARIKIVNDLISTKIPHITSNPAFKTREPLGAREASRDRFQASVDSIEKRTKALEAETAAIDKGTEAREKAKIEAELLAVAVQLNKGPASPEQLAAIEKFASAFGRAAAAIEQARSPLASFGRESANIGKQLNQFAATSLENVTTALADIVTGTKTAAQAFKALSTSIINDLARIAIRQSITGPLASALNSFFPVGGTRSGGAGIGGAGIGGEFIGGASGGLVSGPGTGASDSIIAALSNGEYIVNAEAAKRYRSLLDNINSGMPRFAAGGMVGSSSGSVGEPIININVSTPPGTSSKVERNQTSKGFDIKVMVEQIDAAIAQRTTDGRSHMGRAMSTAYGLRRQGQ